MKLLKLMLLSMLLFSTQACADNQNKETKKEGKNMNQSILTDKPSFNLSIEGENTKMIIYLNGIAVFTHHNLRSVQLNYPVNDFITTGENKLEVFVFSLYNKKELSPNAKCKVTLFVRKFEDFDTPAQDILTLSYNQGKKDKLEGTTKAGIYSSKDGFKKMHREGEVSVKKASTSPFEPVELLPSAGVIAKLEFSLPTPFPRWKFLDASSNILDKPYYGITMEEAKKYQKNHPKLNKLYKINHQIFQTANKGDIDSLVGFFSERNTEEDIAFYRKKGETEQELRKGFKKAMEDTSQALIGSNDSLEKSNKKWKEHYPGFFVERSNSLAYLTNILCWNSINYPGSSCFKMKFRYDGNIWILTR